jgi:MFS transporter, DHA1 family, multidrug resistance protein
MLKTPKQYCRAIRLSAGAYGLIALIIGGANLTGEMACTSLATRTSPRQLCFGALWVYLIGALILLVSGLLVGASFFPITIGGMLALAGCGTPLPDDVRNGARAFLQQPGTARRFH